MDDDEIDQTLIAMLDALASGAKPSKAARAGGMNLEGFNTICRASEHDDRYVVVWSGERLRFSEHVLHAKNIGRVANMNELRGIVVAGAVQYVLDPALLARFGWPDDADAAIMAELHGYPDYPYAHDIDNQRIPLWSARHPRPQRSHRSQIKEPPAALPALTPQPATQGTPAYARKPNAPAPTPPKPKVPMSPALEAAVARLRARAAVPPQNPTPFDGTTGRPMRANTGLPTHTFNDPAEKISGGNNA